MHACICRNPAHAAYPPVSCVQLCCSLVGGPDLGRSQQPAAQEHRSRSERQARTAHASTSRVAGSDSDSEASSDPLEEDEEDSARGELAHGGESEPSSISDDEDLSESEDVLKYTGKVAVRSGYISTRAQLMDGCTYRGALKKKYKNKQGHLVQYRQADMEYDMRNGFLAVEGR